MTLTNCYLTLADLAVRLSLDDQDEDQRLSSAANAACRMIDKWCGQFFYDTGSATARVYRPNNSRELRVDPFSTTTGLIVQTDSDDDGTFATTWGTVDYELSPAGGYDPILGSVPYDEITAVSTSLMFPTWLRRRNSVQITARWGWAAIPEEVSEAAKILAVDLWKRKDTPFGITSATADFGALRIGRDSLAGVMSILQPFRRWDRVVGFA